MNPMATPKISASGAPDSREGGAPAASSLLWFRLGARGARVGGCSLAFGSSLETAPGAAWMGAELTRHPGFNTKAG